MKAKDMYVTLNGLRIHACHGIGRQEQTIGADFLIDLRIKTDFTEAAKNDELEGTINYATVYDIVKKEMGISSKLLEHVCERIAKRLFCMFNKIEEIEIKLYKENPPMGAQVKKCGAEVKYTR